MNYLEKNYFLLLEDFSYWENKKQYLELMEKFIDGKIDGTRFDSQFCRMWRLDRDKYYRWKKDLYKQISFQPSSKIRGFGSLLSEIFTDCDIFNNDPDSREEFELSEDTLRDCVQNILIKIKDRYD